MPLKPIFDKAPLTALNNQPLRAGLVKSDSAALTALYDVVKHAALPVDLEGAFRLACIVTAKPGEEIVAARIRDALSAQQPDGSFKLSGADSVAILRAAWALYEYEARKPLLEHIARWCAWAAANWDALMADDAIWAASADLMELLENLYRVTGKAAVLSLCERVATQCMLWSSALNTLSSQRPTSRDVTREELLRGLQAENGSREGYYTRYYRLNHAETLADGARSAMMKGLYTGSATELNASRNAWEKLCRHHGAICGGLTSDELLEGTSPASGVSTAALGAWAEALCAAALGDQADWAWEAIERMALNAMPAAVADGDVHAFQRVNTLCAEQDEKNFLHVADDHADRAVCRLVRGYAAVMASAVTARPNGAAINLYLPGRYGVMAGDELLVLTMSTTDKGASITVHTRQDVKADIHLRVPAWSANTEISVNNSTHHSEEVTADIHFDRVWHDGDIITLVMEPALRVADGHHQGQYVLRGAVVMALNAENVPFAQALCAARMEDGRVAATLDSVKDWKLRDNVPADVPVLPATLGAPALHVLTPYAKCVRRIALFAGRKLA